MGFFDSLQRNLAMTATQGGPRGQTEGALGDRPEGALGDGGGPRGQTELEFTSPGCYPSGGSPWSLSAALGSTERCLRRGSRPEQRCGTRAEPVGLVNRV